MRQGGFLIETGRGTIYKRENCRKVDRQEEGLWWHEKKGHFEE